MTEPHLLIDPQSNPVVASLDWDPHPGFGFVELWCGHMMEVRLMRLMEDGRCTVQDFENIVVAVDRDYRWWFDIAGPFQGATYERQGPGRWVLVASRDGFA